MKLNNAASLPVKLLRYLLMAFVLLISLYPIAWVLINSFKQTPGGLGFPEKWVFDGYITIFTKLNIGRYFANSLIVTVISTVFSVFVVSLAAYVSARIEFRGKNLVTLMFASTLFIPSISISFPIYRLLSDLGLKDTLTGVIFVYASLGIAVTFFILRSYFLSIPKEMEEAAMMDGCGYTGTYFRIIVPIAKPGLATAAIMAFLNNWNEYYFASILLKSKEHMTLPALLGQFTTAYSKNLNGMFSAIIVIVLPTIIIFCLLSETFVKSLTAGAVKDNPYDRTRKTGTVVPERALWDVPALGALCDSRTRRMVHERGKDPRRAI